ncbi:MAG TPA: hypothetical protein VF525_09710 [Pyrinomonadaceae bacterium]|jgi:fimbrial isopeptide formation D2 family protein/uncharacterized repeat protein (TIGR01451 family)
MTGTARTNSTQTRGRQAWPARGLWLAAALVCAFVFTFAPPSARAQVACATPGTDGPNASLSGVVNTYYPGVGTATISTTTITVGPPTGAADTITAGDLLLVIQMQDATINTSNSSRYGDGASGGSGSGALATSFNAGQYEYVVATNFNGSNTVTIRGTGTGNGLRNTYTSAPANGSTLGQRTFQVIIVPQYSSATISGTLTAQAWNGSTGGVVAVDVAGTLAINGSVNVDGKGFRGGGGRATAGPNPASNIPTTSDYLLPSSYNLNGQKGEGVAGTPHYVFDGTSVIDTGSEGYPGGTTFPTGADTGRGAPGNAGGGGSDGSVTNNEENSGGGGGGNAGPGGVGGLTWSSRLIIGGFGGVMSVAPSATRVVMGGGGGAGSRNNSATVASSGGMGGGIVMIRTGSLTGAGTISANGADAYNLTANDGAGGGGAGGSILVSLPAAANYSGSLVLSARGGRGGDAWNTQPVGTICGSAPCPGDARHGPGGGGGGGFVATTWGSAASVTGGANGITTTGGSPNNVYGATPGTAGTTASLAATTVPGSSSGAQCLPSLTVTKTTSTASVRNTPTGVTATYTITVANAVNLGTAQDISLSDTLPSLFTYASTGTVSLAGSAVRTSISNPTVGATVPAWGLFDIPGGGSVALTFTVNIAATAVGTYQNPATVTYDDPRRTLATDTSVATYSAASSTGEDVTVAGAPKIDLVKSVAPNTGPYTPGMDLTYTITYTNSGGAAAAAFVILDDIPAQTDFKIGTESHTTPLPASLTGVTVNYFDTSTSTWITNPTSGGGGAPAGYNRNITKIRWTFNGTLNAASTTASVSFTVRIK